jgi:hypothetical protein
MIDTGPSPCSRTRSIRIRACGAQQEEIERLLSRINGLLPK